MHCAESSIGAVSLSREADSRAGRHTDAGGRHPPNANAGNDNAALTADVLM